MEIIVSGRHFDISPGLKEYAEGIIKDTFADIPLKITSVRMILDRQKNRQIAEIIVNMKHSDVESVAETFDMHKSIDEVIEKASKQIRKHLDKLQDHKKDRSSIKDAKTTGEEDA